MKPAGAGLECQRCARSYPSIGGIPVLVRKPEDLVAQFRTLARRFDHDVRLGSDELLSQLTTFDLIPRRRARLEALHGHLIQHRTRLAEILSDAGLLEPRQEPSSTAGKSPLRASAITEHYTQIHRDWRWDATDNPEASQATAAVSAAIGARPIGRLLVLGAGACRLTHDLHHLHGATETLALDVNPLPFLVASRILRGESVRLYEFTAWPRYPEHLYAERVLMSPLAPTAGLHLLFADALAPPVPPHSFDTVLTPWFIDQVPLDVPELARRISGLLKPRGRWINFGPLLYEQDQIALPHRYSMDEVLELVQQAGFALAQHRFEPMSYLTSPLSCRARTEMVLTFSAEKEREPEPRTTDRSGARLDPTAPVPLFGGIDTYRAEHPMFAVIARLIDGRRTPSDIASVLVQRHGLPAEAALPAVEACLQAIQRKVGLVR